MSERRVVIVIEYDSGPGLERALTEAMRQIREGADRLDREHIKVVQVHVAIKDVADRVLAVFDDEVTTS